MKILLLAPYPLRSAPSQRYRFEHFLDARSGEGIDWAFQSFYSQKAWDRLYRGGWIRILDLLLGYGRRKLLFFTLHRYDRVFIHRELTPLGPPVFEWLIARIWRKKIIYDFDDAIWLNDGHDGNFTWWLKARWKVSRICQWSWKVSAGNAWLAEFAHQFNSQVEVIPTVVDTDVHQKRLKPVQRDKVVIGWTGSHSTLMYLDPLVEVIRLLEANYEFEFHVICNHNPQYDLQSFRFVPWNKATEIEDLAALDIGLMPLPDEEWTQGKCGFKLIQYGAMGIPAVASPVGVNTDILRDGTNGYLATDPDEWLENLSRLLGSEELRKDLGAAGRRVIVERYSVESAREKFLDLVKE